MRAIIKYLIEAMEYIFDVFALMELVLNGHTSELIEKEVSVSGHLLRVMALALNSFSRVPELPQIYRFT